MRPPVRSRCARCSQPEHELLPGMYVHATVDNGVDPKAILAPQQGITRNAKGEATALVVDEQTKWRSAPSPPNGGWAATG